MKIVRIIIPGLIIWIVPFILGSLFYSTTGDLSIDIFLFKTIMILTIVVLSVLLSMYHLKRSTDNSVSMSLMVGLTWLLIPILLDALILIPIAEMTATDYTYQIGLRYLVVPIIHFSHNSIFRLKTKQA